MGGRERLHAEADRESRELAALCAAWWEAPGERPVPAGDVFTVCKERRLLLDIWAGRSALSAQQRLGHALTRRQDRVYGEFVIRAAKTFAAEVEREKLIERTVRGTRACVASGKPLAGPRPPDGYRWADAAKTRLLENPLTAHVVKRIFAAVAGGASARQVAKTLTAEGVPKPAGKPVWSGETVTAILRHPVYVGESRAFRRVDHRQRGRLVGRDRFEAEQLPLPEVAPALVTAEIAAAAVRRLPLNQRRATRNNRHPEEALLRGGFAVCGYCGRALHVLRTNGRATYTAPGETATGAPGWAWPPTCSTPPSGNASPACSPIRTSSRARSSGVVTTIQPRPRRRASSGGWMSSHAASATSSSAWPTSMTPTSLACCERSSPR